MKITFFVLCIFLVSSQSACSHDRNIENPSGWFRKDINSYTAPVVSDGKLYVCDNNSIIYCLDTATGKTLWNRDCGSEIIGQPALYDKQVFIATSCSENTDNKLYETFSSEILCLDDKNGDIIRKYDCIDVISTSLYPIRGCLFFGTQNEICCLDIRNGQYKWIKKANLCQNSGLAEFALVEECIYYSDFRKLICASIDDGSVVWEQTTEGKPLSPASRNGKVYFCSLASVGYINYENPKSLVSTFHCIDHKKRQLDWTCEVKIAVSNAPVLSDTYAMLKGFYGMNACVDLASRQESWLVDSDYLNMPFGKPMFSNGKAFIVNYPDVIEVDTRTGRKTKTVSVGKYATMDSNSCFSVTDEGLACNSIENPMSWDILKNLPNPDDNAVKDQNGFMVGVNSDNGVFVFRNNKVVWSTPKDWILCKSEHFDKDHPYFWNDGKSVAVILYENEKQVYCGLELSTGKVLWSFEQRDDELLSFDGERFTFVSGLIKYTTLDISNGKTNDESLPDNGGPILYEADVSDFGTRTNHDLVQLAPFIYLIKSYGVNVHRNRWNNTYHLVDLKGKACAFSYQGEDKKGRLLGNGYYLEGIYEKEGKFAFSIEYSIEDRDKGLTLGYKHFIADTSTGSVQEVDKKTMDDWKPFRRDLPEKTTLDMIEKRMPETLSLDDDALYRMTGLKAEKSTSHYDVTEVKAFGIGDVGVAVKKRTISNDDLSFSTIKAMVGFDIRNSKKLWELGELENPNLVFLGGYIINQGGGLIDAKTGKISTVLTDITVIDVKGSTCIAFAKHKGKQKIVVLRIDRLEKFFD